MPPVSVDIKSSLFDFNHISYLLYRRAEPKVLRSSFCLPYVVYEGVDDDLLDFV